MTCPYPVILEISFMDIPTIKAVLLKSSLVDLEGFEKESREFHPFLLKV